MKSEGQWMLDGWREPAWNEFDYVLIVCERVDMAMQQSM
jgi:hypothetical protein